MTTRPPSRSISTRWGVHRAAVLVATALVAALLPLVLGPGPAAAAADCHDETHAGNEILGATGCDDITPPGTTITSVDPAPSALGFSRRDSVVFTFTGTHSPGDAGPIGFECQFFHTVSPPTAWETCSSPRAYSGLEEFTSTPYTFRVRAVDSHDAAIAACDATAEVLDVTCAGEEAIQDMDASPAVRSIKVDTVAPNTFLNKEPVDDIRPDWPVVLTTSPTVAVNSNEAASYVCTVNGRSVRPCADGLVTLSNLKAGNQTFVARAVDRAFNVDPTAVTTTFFVPANIKRNKGSVWRKVRQAGLFGNDYVTADRVGQTLRIRGLKNVREVRLLAPTGPRFGRIAVRVGTSQWYSVNLYARKPSRLRQIVVRDEYTPPQSGSIQIRVTSLRGKGSSVRLDALVARS